MSGPLWGYTACGRARIFYDGVLPPGWHPTPQVEISSDEASALDLAEQGRSPAVEPRDAAPAGDVVPTPAEVHDALEALDPAPVPVRRRGRPPKPPRAEGEAA